jgi:extracellular factor (EF) 3-hydroxypalmitic acid methyl ester biosynthesis protein
MSESARKSYMKATDLLMAPYVIEKLSGFGRRAHQIVKSMPDRETLKFAKKVFRRDLDEFLKCAPFIERARQKPLGYAGDFEMMNQIYRNQFEGTTLFGGLLHKWAVNEASSHSVRYRRQFFKDKFRTLATARRKIKVASIAAGPAKEVLDFIEESPQSTLDLFQFVIIDQDKEALLNAKRYINDALIKQEKAVHVIYVPLSVKQILEGCEAGSKLASYGFDLVYSVGLYDYLTQPTAKLLTKELSLWLSIGGEIVIGNFHPSNPTHTMSEFAADWSLILRTEKDLLEIVEGLPLGPAQVTSDDQGIELFLSAQRLP